MPPKQLLRPCCLPDHGRCGLRQSGPPIWLLDQATRGTLRRLHWLGAGLDTAELLPILGAMAGSTLPCRARNGARDKSFLECLWDLEERIRRCWCQERRRPLAYSRFLTRSTMEEIFFRD